jgi:hypothetical protein
MQLREKEKKLSSNPERDGSRPCPYSLRQEYLAAKSRKLARCDGRMVQRKEQPELPTDPHIWQKTNNPTFVETFTPIQDTDVELEQ